VISSARSIEQLDQTVELQPDPAELEILDRSGGATA
jgi:hypothetical protein